MDPERDRDGGREGWLSTTQNSKLPDVIKCTPLWPMCPLSLISHKVLNSSHLQVGQAMSVEFDCPRTQFLQANVLTDIKLIVMIITYTFKVMCLSQGSILKLFPRRGSPAAQRALGFLPPQEWRPQRRREAGLSCWEVSGWRTESRNSFFPEQCCPWLLTLFCFWAKVPVEHGAPIWCGDAMFRNATFIGDVQHRVLTSARLRGGLPVLHFYVANFFRSRFSKKIWKQWDVINQSSTAYLSFNKLFLALL